MLFDLIILASLFCSHIVYSISTLPAYYTYPTLNTNSKVTITSNVNLNNQDDTVYKVIRTSPYYISRRSNYGKLQIFYINDNSLQFNLFSNTQYPSSDLISAYDLPEDNNSLLVVLFETTQIVSVYKLCDNGTVSLFYQLTVLDSLLPAITKLGIQIINNDLLVLGYQNGSTKIYKFQNFSTSYTTINTNFTGQTFNIKTCGINQNSQNYKFAIWKSNCYVQVFNCENGICISILYQLNNACNSTELSSTSRDYKNLNWNSDCTKIIYQWKNTGLKIINLSTNLTLITYSMSSSYLINYWFIDDYDIFVGILNHDSEFLIYNTSSTTKLKQTQISDVSLASYSSSKRSLMITKQQKLRVYKFGCSSTKNFQTTGICTNKTNTTTNNLSLTTNNTISQDQQNNTTPNITINNQTVSVKASLPAVQPINTFEASIGQATTNSFITIGSITSYSISFFQYFPFAFLFMKFINFWSICTMYLLPGFVFPTYLRDVLLGIYENINKSLFNTFGISPSINTKLTQKFNDQDNQMFGFTSDILNANIQSFSILTFSYMILGIIYLLSKKLPTNNCIRRKLVNIDYQMAALAQFILIMNIFLFNLPVITQRSYQLNFNQKINLFIQHLFFIISSIIPCLAIIFIQKKHKHQSQKQQILKEKMDWFVDSMCNVFLPFIAIIRNIPLFLTTNFFFFLIPIYSALKEKHFRLNKIIQSLYIPLLNISVIGMSLFTNESFENVFHYLALFSTLIIFIGAIHEILTLVCGLVYDLIDMIRCKRVKIQNNNNELRDKISVQKLTEQTSLPKKPIRFLKANKIVLKGLTIKKNVEMVQNVSIQSITNSKKPAKYKEQKESGIVNRKEYSFRLFKNKRKYNDIGNLVN